MHYQSLELIIYETKHFKICLLFLKVPNTSISAKVSGKRLNRGGDYYSLKIPVIYCFHG